MAGQQSTIEMSPNPTDLWHFDLTRFFLLSIAFGSITFVILFGIAGCIVESVYKLSEIFFPPKDHRKRPYISLPIHLETSGYYEFLFGPSFDYIIQSNLVIRIFLVTLILFLNAKCSLFLWSKLTIGHGKWFLNTNLFLIKTFLITKFDCSMFLPVF